MGVAGVPAFEETQRSKVNRIGSPRIRTAQLLSQKPSTWSQGLSHSEFLMMSAKRFDVQPYYE